MGNSPETMPNNSQETEPNSAETAAERKEQLDNSPEIGVENPDSVERTAEKAKSDAIESAVSIESGSAEKKKDDSSVSSKRRGPISKKEKEASFKRQMKDVQALQKPVSRAFSKFIHNKTIERTSDAIGATIARPDAILAGAVVAFLLTLTVYLVAKNIGYQLSGFETIASFVIGWVIGLIYDYLRALVTGKK